MFRELFGLPAHALIVHAAVVFIPLAAVGAILYALWPAIRRHIWWAVLGLGVAAPLTGWAARLSGQEYKAYWLAHSDNVDFLAQINRHQSFGDTLSWWVTAFGLAVLVLVLYAIPGPISVGRTGTAGASGVVRLVTVVVTVALALVTLYYVIRTGDAGAHASHVEL